MRNNCTLWAIPGGLVDQPPIYPADCYPPKTLFRSSDGSVYHGSELVAKLRPYPYPTNWWR